MKLKESTGRKLRYGGVSAVLTVLIVAAIILVNVIFSALSQKFTLYTDLTPELLFTLSDEAIDLIENGDDTFKDSFSPIQMVDRIREESKAYNEANGLRAGDAGYRNEHAMIQLIFCDEPDAWTSDLVMHYVYNTGLELQARFPDHIEVKNYDIERNPSVVSKYKLNSDTVIGTDYVIVALDTGANDGLRYRIRDLASFYLIDSEDPSNPEPWAYNGDKAFCSSILAVTNAEAPVACYVSNHGATVNEYLTESLIDAGYEVDVVNLAEQEIPANCRLLIIFDPKEDFWVKDGASEVDELEKIENHLYDNTASMMVFFNPNTPVLPELEDYLAEWGIQFDRNDQNIAHTVYDPEHSLNVAGTTVIGEYALHNPAAKITEAMRSRPYPQSVIFKNAMSLSHSSLYSPQRYTDESDPSITYDYSSYTQDGTVRTVYDLFTTHETAYSLAGDHTQKAELASATNKPALMTMSIETRGTQETQYTTMTDASYVLACGSTEFVSQELMESNAYGNTDLLLSALRTMGQEPVPVGITFKAFADKTIDTITTAESTQYTVILTVIPPVVALIAGIFVIVRRKNR